MFPFDQFYHQNNPRMSKVRIFKPNTNDTETRISSKYTDDSRFLAKFCATQICCSKEVPYKPSLANCHHSESNMKLRCLWDGVTRCVSWNRMQNVAQAFFESHMKISATGKWPWRSFKVIGNRQTILVHTRQYLNIVVCSGVSTLCHFWDPNIYTLSQYMWACNLEVEVLHFRQTVGITSYRWILSYVYTHLS